MPTIDFVYFNAGGGHRAAALALQEVIREQGRPWRVRLVNLTEVLDPTGRFRRITGMDPEDIYNWRLARGWTLGLAQELRLLQGFIRLMHGMLVTTLQAHWARTEPDLVVSLIPNFNRALCESVASALPGVPYATVLTDMADHPPHFWIEPGQQQHLVCGTERAMQQARDAGYADAQLSLTSGMILRPAFYREIDMDRAAELARMGLDPQRPTGLVLFGGPGSMQMHTIARLLDGQQLILMCGHNAQLAQRLHRLRRTAPHAVIGFTPEVPRCMALADYFIGKPGPGSVSEAVHMGLPVITFSNPGTLPQERFNARWVVEQGLGQVVRSIAALPRAVGSVLADLPEIRARLRRFDNRAVHEIPDILGALLTRAATGSGTTLAPRPRAAVAIDGPVRRSFRSGEVAG